MHPGCDDVVRTMIDLIGMVTEFSVKPTEFYPIFDGLLIALDVEADSDMRGLVSDVGIAVLDTRTLASINLKDINIADMVVDKIEAYNIRSSEYLEYGSNFDKPRRKHSKISQFAQPEMMSVTQIKQFIIEFATSPTFQAASAVSPSTFLPLATFQAATAESTPTSLAASAVDRNISVKSCAE